MVVTGALCGGATNYYSSAESSWTFDDIKAFELALARHCADQDRWDKLAAAFPEKDRMDLQLKFRELEDDLLRIEEDAPLTTWGCSRTSSTTGSDVSAPLFPPVILTTHLEPQSQQTTHTPAVHSKKGGNKAEAGDRRKGVPWSEEEHRLFLLGLAKFGKGDWRSISRNFVTSRTPTQVASHAQKYFIRLNSQNKKDKRRASIHDITSPIDPSSMSSLQVSNQLGAQSGGLSHGLSLPAPGGLPSFLPGTSSGPSLLPPVAPSLVNLTV